MDEIERCPTCDLRESSGGDRSLRGQVGDRKLCVDPWHGDTGPDVAVDLPPNWAGRKVYRDLAEQYGLVTEADEDGSSPVVVGPDGSEQSLVDWVKGTDRFIKPPPVGLPYCPTCFIPQTATGDRSQRGVGEQRLDARTVIRGGECDDPWHDTTRVVDREVGEVYIDHARPRPWLPQVHDDADFRPEPNPPGAWSDRRSVYSSQPGQLTVRSIGPLPVRDVVDDHDHPAYEQGVSGIEAIVWFGVAAISLFFIGLLIGLVIGG